MPRVQERVWSIRRSAALLASCALLACGKGEGEDPYDVITGRVEAPEGLDLSKASVVRCRDDKWDLPRPLMFGGDPSGLASPDVLRALEGGVRDPACAPIRADRTFSLRVRRGEVVDMQVVQLELLSNGRSPESVTRGFILLGDDSTPRCVVGVVGGYGGEARGVRAGARDVRIVLRPVSVGETLVHVRDPEGRPVAGSRVAWRSLADWACVETDASGVANLGPLPRREGVLIADVPRGLADRMVRGRTRATAGGDLLSIALRVGVPIRVRFEGSHPPVLGVFAADPVEGRGRMFGWRPDADGVSVVLAEPEWAEVLILADGEDPDDQPFASSRTPVSENLTVTLKARAAR